MSAWKSPTKTQLATVWVMVRSFAGSAIMAMSIHTASAAAAVTVSTPR